MTAKTHIDELLVDRAIWGHLGELESRALHWEYTAGAVTAALLDEELEGGLERPPTDLLRRVRGDALGFFAGEAGVGVRGTTSAGPWGRLVAAAVLLVSVSVAASLWWAQPATAPSAQERMTALLNLGSSDVSRLVWRPGPSDLRGEVRGEIVWSGAAQEGYMRFVGLPANDPSESQYQLWIFDAQRSDAHPVDGGVFDISPGSRELVIPINAKIKVNEPVMFAVTVEDPGGVVVSDREHIVALASI